MKNYHVSVVVRAPKYAASVAVDIHQCDVRLETVQQWCGTGEVEWMHAASLHVVPQSHWLGDWPPMHCIVSALPTLATRWRIAASVLSARHNIQQVSKWASTQRITGHFQDKYFLINCTGTDKVTHSTSRETTTTTIQPLVHDNPGKNSTAVLQRNRLRWYSQVSVSSSCVCD